MVVPSQLGRVSRFFCSRLTATFGRCFSTSPLADREVGEEEDFGGENSNILNSVHQQKKISLVRKKLKRPILSAAAGTSQKHVVNPFLVEIQTLCQQGKLDHALQRLCLRSKVCTTRDVYVCLLKACIQHQALPQAMQIHDYLVKYKADLSGIVGDYLVVTLAKCGGLELARSISALLPQRTVFSWTALISAYTDAGRSHEALSMYQSMLEEGIEPDHYTFVSLLKACGSILDLNQGQQLHLEAKRMGLASDVFVGNTLVSMYGKCGDIPEAENVFVGLSVHDEVAFNSMLSVYIEQGCVVKALQLYRQMQEQGVRGNSLTFGITIQACHALAELEDAPDHMKDMALEIGRGLHHDSWRAGLTSDAFLANMLVSLYGKCGVISESEAVFCMFNSQDAQFWTIMLSAYVEQSEGEKALQFYRNMLLNGIRSDSYIYVAALQACLFLIEKTSDVFPDGSPAQELGLEVGMALHEDLKRAGFISDVYVATALLTMYGKFGKLVEAEEIFYSLSEYTVVSWTAILTAYVEQGEHVKVLCLFQNMLEDSIPLDDVTMICGLQACSEVGDLDICKQIHIAIISAGGYGKKIVTLVHAYASCASMQDAYSVFDELVQANIISWGACMAGYAGEGNFTACLKMHEAMLLSGMNPNEVTFSSVLSACSHSGLSIEALEYFDSMVKDYVLMQEPKHYVNMIDLLGRAGDFKKLKSMLDSMPVQANLNMWLSLLGMCLRHGNIELGKWAFDQATTLNPTESVAYILMSNIYAESAFEANILGLFGGTQHITKQY